MWAFGDRKKDSKTENLKKDVGLVRGERMKKKKVRREEGVRVGGRNKESRNEWRKGGKVGEREDIVFGEPEEVIS